METSAQESKKVRLVDQYKELGFTPYQAQKLARVAGLGIETVRDILNKGCSVKLAYRIYRP